MSDDYQRQQELASIRRIFDLPDNGWYATYRREVEAAWEAGRLDREIEKIQRFVADNPWVNEY